MPWAGLQWVEKLLAASCVNPACFCDTSKWTYHSTCLDAGPWERNWGASKHSIPRSHRNAVRLVSYCLTVSLTMIVAVCRPSISWHTLCKRQHLHMEGVDIAFMMHLIIPLADGRRAASSSRQLSINFAILSGHSSGLIQATSFHHRNAAWHANSVEKHENDALYCPRHAW